jgi:hypothetical protein
MALFISLGLLFQFCIQLNRMLEQLSMGPPPTYEKYPHDHRISNIHVPMIFSPGIHKNCNVDHFLLTCVIDEGVLLLKHRLGFHSNLVFGYP